MTLHVTEKTTVSCIRQIKSENPKSKIYLWDSRLMEDVTVDEIIQVHGGQLVNDDCLFVGVKDGPFNCVNG